MKSKVVVLGQFQEGKSTLINGLLSSPSHPLVAKIGSGFATTKKAVLYQIGAVPVVEGKGTDFVTLWSESLECYLAASKSPPCDYIRIALPHPLLNLWDLVDSPGFDSTDSSDEKIALHEAELANFGLIVFRHAPAHSANLVTRVLAQKFAGTAKPYGVVLNCGRNPDLQHWDSQGAEEVEQAIRETLAASGCGTPVFIQRVNLMNYLKHTLCRHDAGELDCLSPMLLFKEVLRL